MALTTEEVRKVARLARLELDDNEIESQAKHLNRLLTQIEVLGSVHVEGIDPTSHSIPMFNVLRDDVAKPSLSREDALANAPESRDGCFIVPRIVEG